MHMQCRNILTFWRPAFANNPRNSFYICSQQGNLHFKTSCIISVLFSTKCHLFHNFFISVSSNNMFFINHALKFKHPSWKDIGYSFHIHIVLGTCAIQKFSDYVNCNTYTYVYYCGKWDAPHQATDTHQYQKRCIQRYKVDSVALKLKNANIRGYKYRVSEPHVVIPSN